MTTSPTRSPDNDQSVILAPNPRLPLLITALGLSLLPLPLHPWLSLIVCALGLFLLLQAFLLRLEFTANDLVLWQAGREIRRFPFESWLAWRMFLPGLPGILYFREQASPHLLPILFDAIALKSQLELRVGPLQRPSATSPSSNDASST
ncbi:MAG: DUF3119 family protein [Prochlorococcus sp.]|nr:DUF3119 family protein [Prochlorococcaceae cyanobacterium Fu_MAG_50]